MNRRRTMLMNGQEEDGMKEWGELLNESKEVTEGKHWESGWTEEENAIRQVWTLVDDPVYPEPELSAEEALNIIMGVVQ